MSEPLLSVRDLRVSYQVGRNFVHAVDGASFDIPRGSITGLVGESGCGKTTVARALTRVIAENAAITGGQILFDGKDLAKIPEKEMNALRWRDIAFIPQSAMNSLDPVYTVEYQARRSAAPPRRPEPQTVPCPFRGTVRDGRHRCEPPERLSAPVLRRHAPARGHRLGTRPRPEADHRRRAGDGARRHRAAADPRPGSRSCRRGSAFR